MSTDGENFGGTKLVAEDGTQMDPSVAGIAPPSIPTMEADAAGAAIGADLEDDDTAEKNHQADVTASGAE